LPPEQVAADRTRLLAALAAAGEVGLTQTEVSAGVFARNRTRAQLTALLDQLAGENLVVSQHQKEPGVKRPIVRWRLIDTRANSFASGEAAGAPPEGEGWIPWPDALTVAEASVDPRFALRMGKRIRARERKRNKTRYHNRTTLSDEERGARYLARRALSQAVRDGTIERAGQWCRLARNPRRQPGRFMYSVYARLGEAHPTLTGYWEPPGEINGAAPGPRPARRPKPKASPAPVAIHQLRICLDEIEPVVWRRIQVPSDVNLVRLHEVLQAAMGWGDMHLHSYGGRHNSMGTPIDSYEWTTTLAEFAPEAGWSFSYQYDFGDYWEHTVVVEKVIPTGRRSRYPVCLGGRRACPPEDCGGPPGYWELLRQTRNRRGGLYYWYREMYDRSFKPEAFDLEEINGELAELQERVMRPPGP
jgi:hypothetical protein